MNTDSKQVCRYITKYEVKTVSNLISKQKPAKAIAILN